MARATTNPAQFIKDTGKTLLGRVENPAGAVITQAGLTAITYSVKNLTSEAFTIAAGTAITISAAVFDSLQGANNADARWNADSVGYNFRFEVPATAFLTAGVNYLVDFRFDPTSGENFALLFKGPCVDGT